MDYSEWKKSDPHGLDEYEIEETFMQVESYEQAHMNAWMENLTENIDRVHDESDWIRSVYGTATGPVIICGAGPSLSQNLGWLKAQVTDGVHVIAVDRALGLLKENGIRPNLTVSIDDQKVVREFYKDFDEQDAVALSLVTHPTVAERTRIGKTMWFGIMDPFSPFWKLAATQYGSDDMQQVRTGGVVTYSAVDIAVWMGYNPIITIGNELSFKTRLEAYAYFNNEFNYKNALRDAPNNRFTILAFHVAAQCFNKLPELNPEVTFLDASDGIVAWNKLQPIGLIKSEVHNGSRN